MQVLCVPFGYMPFMTIQKMRIAEATKVLDRTLSQYSFRESRRGDRIDEWGNRRYGSAASSPYLKQSSLVDVARIERARWRALEMWEKHASRWDGLYNEVKAADGECFVPRTDGELADAEDEEMQEWLARRTEIEQANWKRSQTLPRRMIVDPHRSSVSYDDNFWDYREPKDVGPHALHKLAEVGHLLDWEQELVVREARISPEKLDIGRRFQAHFDRGNELRLRIGRLTQWLDTAITLLGIFKKSGEDRARRYANVTINGRKYLYGIETHRPVPMFDMWPEPDSLRLEVDYTGEFSVDESLIGCYVSAVVLRLGEPDMILKTSEREPKGNVWIYGKRGVRLCGFYHDVVEKILDERAVRRLLSKLKAQKKSKTKKKKKKTKKKKRVARV